PACPPGPDLASAGAARRPRGSPPPGREKGPSSRANAPSRTIESTSRGSRRGSGRARLPALVFRSQALVLCGRLRLGRHLLVGLHLDVELDVVADNRGALLDTVVLAVERQSDFETGLIRLSHLRETEGFDGD